MENFKEKIILNQFCGEKKSKFNITHNYFKLVCE